MRPCLSLSRSLEVSTRAPPNLHRRAGTSSLCRSRASAPASTTVTGVSWSDADAGRQGRNVVPAQRSRRDVDPPADRPAVELPPNWTFPIPVPAVASAITVAGPPDGAVVIGRGYVGTALGIGSVHVFGTTQETNGAAGLDAEVTLPFNDSVPVSGNVAVPLVNVVAVSEMFHPAPVPLASLTVAT